MKLERDVEENRKNFMELDKELDKCKYKYAAKEDFDALFKRFDAFSDIENLN